MSFDDAWEILKIRSASPPRRPNPMKRRPMAQKPEPEPEPEPVEEEPDPAMARRGKQVTVDAVNAMRRKRGLPMTSVEEMEGTLDDMDYSEFLKPPEERQ